METIKVILGFLSAIVAYFLIFTLGIGGVVGLFQLISWIQK